MNDSRILTFRPASIGDADLLLTWRNDEQTRLASRSTAYVTTAEHQIWLTRMLASTDHLVQIAELDRVPAGVMRAARTPEGWELSWTVAPNVRGQGIGSRMLKAFTARLSGRMIAVIHHDNVASARMATAAGFEVAGTAPDQNFNVWIRT